MSYLLHGSGTLLGPCISTLFSREVARFAPCVCLRCSRLLESTVNTAVQHRSLSQYNTTCFPSTSTVPGLPSTTRNGDHLSVAARREFPTDLCRQKYHTSFESRLPLLGTTAPLLVNLNFSCGPDIQTTGVQYRFLHSSSILEKKASSKLEESVIRMKERQAETLSELSKVEDLEKEIRYVIEKDDQLNKAVKVSVEQKKEVTKKTLGQRFMDEVRHYYSGFKLLYLDVKVSTKIIRKVLNGKVLSRRENRQLVRTVSDLFRLVPFSVFILVPFMELLLPVALKLFPGMLPSTFTSKDEREVKMRRALKAKLEYAKFLQVTLDEMAPISKSHKSQSARDFVGFYQDVKSGDKLITNKDILKFSKLFEDEITLDNMTRGQLVALCRLLELTPIGTNAFLRFQIEMQLRKLKADDRLISREGVDSLNVMELQNACKERGMRALGLTQEKLKTNLKEWIELSTNEQVPPSLLLLSRTLYLPATINPAIQIAAAVSALPETAATGAKAKLGEREGKIENVTRLEVIKAEQAMIEEEEAEKTRVEAEDAQKEEELREKQTKLAQEALERALEEQKLTVPPPASPSAESIVTEAVSILKKATVSSEGDLKQMDAVAHAVVNDDIHVGHVIQEGVPSAVKSVSPLSKELSKEDLKAIKNAISAISKEKGSEFINEQEVLLDLKQELVDYEEDLGELNEQAALSGRRDLKQSKGAARLFSRVNKMLNSINDVVGKLESREKEVKSQIDVLEEAGVATGDQEGHLVTVQDLLQAVRGIQEVPDSSRLERIGEVVASMDEDSDGIVKIEHVNKVIELLGRDNVNLNPKQIKQIIDLIGKEEMLEVEGRIEKILGKLPSYEQAKKKIEALKKSEELHDPAVELKGQEPEQHIASLFIRPPKQAAKNKEASPEEQPSIQQEEPLVAEEQQEVPREQKAISGLVQENQIERRKEQGSSSGHLTDNSIKDVTHQLENTKEIVAEVGAEQKKATSKNGSKH